MLMQPAWNICTRHGFSVHGSQNTKYTRDGNYLYTSLVNVSNVTNGWMSYQSSAVVSTAVYCTGVFVLPRPQYVISVLYWRLCTALAAVCDQRLLQ